VATIKDVAKRAGVGLGTASRVVSGKGPVAPATLERVQKAIEELEYRPSHAARALLSGSSQMIGVYIPMLKGTFYTPILQAIDTRLRSQGLNMVVAFGVGSGDGRQQAIEGIQFLMDRGCDGLIAMTHFLTQDDITALAIKQSRIVLMNHLVPLIGEQCFMPDHTQGGRIAAQALLGQGHRRIAVIGGPWSAPDNSSRIAGFMSEIERAGIDPAGVWYASSDFSPEGGWAQAARLLESKYEFSALFCANDEMAIGAMAYLQQHGVRIPQDVSVIGYDDSPAAEFSFPCLTTVRIPWVEITINALDALLNRCYRATHPVKRAFQISLSTRKSLGAPNERFKA
jgi:LacI family transcriptional regulator